MKTNIKNKAGHFYKQDFYELDRLCHKILGIGIDKKEIERSAMKMKDKNGKQLKEGNKIQFKGKNGVLTFGSIQGVSTWFVKTDNEEIPICNVSEADLEVIGGVNA